MKRKIESAVLLIIIIIGIISLVTFKEKEQLESVKTNSNKLISMMLQDEEGNYIESTDINFPIDKYVFNSEKSGCENGGTLSWNEEKQKVQASLLTSDKCYAYFDKAQNGTKERPYLIQTIEDLVELAKNVNEEEKHYEGKYVVLTKDLDFTKEEDYENAQRTDYGDINGNRIDDPLITELTTGTGFEPIGNDETNSFQGNFDGQEHTINNIYIVSKIESTSVGFFGVIKNATISNLKLTGINESTISIDGGGIIGKVYGTTRLENLKNEVNVSRTLGSASIGGVLGVSGENANLEIINSTNTGMISGSNNAGGIVGYTNGTLIIDNCINYGEIINAVGVYVGGILGRDNVATNKTTITNSHNEGDVSSTNYSGGLVGRANGIIKIFNSHNGKTANSIVSGVRTGGLVGGSFKQMEMTNSYNISKVKDLNTSGSKTGGLVGMIQGLDISKITNSYNTGSVTGLFRTGGLIGLIEANIIIDSCYNTGAIEDTGSSLAGGLAAQVYPLEQNNTTTDIHAIFINSYNTGNIISKSNAGGIVSSISSKASILNSYNIGNLNVTANGFGIGILRNSGVISNLYNLGTITGSGKYGIGYEDNFTGKLENAYYKSGTYTSNNVGTSMTEVDMKKQSFVDTLNKNMTSMDLSSDLEGYPLKLWELGSDSIPTFAYDIKDISGRENNALDFSESKTSEGIVTGTKGYVNAGFVKYNFGDSLSYVIRLKFNNLNAKQYIMGNWESAGGGLSINADNTIYASFYGADLATPAYVTTNNSKTTVDSNNWYTLIATVDGTNIKVYINGVEEITSPLKGKIKSSVAPLVFGGNARSMRDSASVMTDYTNLLVSDALIFDRALTAEEIKKNYKDIPNPENKDELLAWYKFS